MSLRSPRTRAAIVVLLAFLGGAFLGVVGDRLALLHQHRLLPRTGMRFVADRIASRLGHDLDLTPEQKAEVKSILEKHRVKIEAEWTGIQPKVKTEIDAADREIDQLLDAKQKVRFHEIRKRWREHAGNIMH